jgi:hypothetical protein
MSPSRPTPGQGAEQSISVLGMGAGAVNTGVGELHDGR